MVLPLLDTATELLTGIIIPELEVHDVIALGCSSRLLHRLLLASDSSEAEYIWKRRIKQDLRFPVESTARQSGWLELYRKIRIPHVYLWGEGRNGRLAIERNDPRVTLLERGGFVAAPARLPIRVPIVDLVAGGCSFHALSADGKVYHWGQLDGESFAPIRQLNNPNGPPVPLAAWPGAMIPAVTQLSADVPPISRLLSGRKHVLALDEQDRLWTWANWAEAGFINPTADTSDGNDADAWLDYAKHRIRDFTAGWAFSAVLLEDRKSGKRSTHAWWQRFQSPSLEQSQLRPNFGGNNAYDNTNPPSPIEGKAGCYSFSPQQVLRLPDLPIQRTSEGEVIEKLAAGDNYLIALSNHGKVYKLDLSKPNLGPGGGFAPAAGGHLQGLVPDQNDNNDHEDGRMARRNFVELERLIMTGRREWEYLERFSESQYWQAEGSGSTSTAPSDSEAGETKVEKKREKRIKFISANFRTFFCIGDGAVLQGSSETTAEMGPLVRPELQDRGVIRVECGDWHFGALTASGELLTFGGYSNGALGHGLNNARLDASLRGSTHDRAVSVPSQVSFLDPQRLDSSTGPDEYCFNIAMAGWHSGALCVNLQAKADEEDGQLDVRSARLQTRDKGKSKVGLGPLVLLLALYAGLVMYQSLGG